VINILKIAARNVSRYRRRTIMTSLLITIGIVVVLVFASVAGSFKSIMIGQITDSMLGHLQLHRKGYVASLENIPQHLNMNPKQYEKLSTMLDKSPAVQAYSPRIKLGGMISNFDQTANIRLNGIYPEKESETCPLLASRIVGMEKRNARPILKKGEILLPQLIAKGMNIKIGQDIVIIATNKDGSVNGRTFTVGGMLEQITGPGGRDGYIHIEDAVSLLRMSAAKPGGEEAGTTAADTAPVDETDKFEMELAAMEATEPAEKPVEISGDEKWTAEISEIAVRLKDFDDISSVQAGFDKELGAEINKQGKPMFEIHDWRELSPFSSIVQIIDVMNLFVKIILIAIVLVSIMNVMVTAVYERVREIGTISAIGTVPGRILSLFVTEGLLLGLVGVGIGNLSGAIIIFILNINKITMSFGRQENLVLSPSIDLKEMILISVVVLIVSVLASLQPAHKASKMEPVDALRHV